MEVMVQVAKCAQRGVCGNEDFSVKVQSGVISYFF